MITATVMPPRYRILETIGRGGMGEVCLADDLVLDRRVALKFLTSSPDDRGDALNQLLREARAAAALDHPFICKIFEVTELEGRPCIAMEYVAGETLERRLRRGPLAVLEALRLAEEMAEALEAAHKRRLVHRDLKPANVIVTEGDHIKVMDFGLATRLPAADSADHDPTLTIEIVERGILLGTPAYMSPEQARGRSVDRRTDIFAFGTLLYELLSGTHPFRRPGLEATLAAILHDTPSDLHERASAVPKAVGAVVAQMLAKDPAARYQSFGEVRLELRRLSGELASPSTPDIRPLVVEAPLSGARGPFVGRETERAELLNSLHQAVAGRGALILLGGEAGVGKSRLAEEALAEARRLGCLTLIGRCYEQEGTQPLIPYVEAIEEAAQLLAPSVFRDVVGRTAPELARLVPELHVLFPDMPPPLELPPELRQRFLFNNVREFLSRCSRATPLAIFLDDLHWADEPTLQLTQHLAQHLDRMRVIVIGAYREIDFMPAQTAARPFDRILQRLRGAARRTPLTEHPLTRALDELLGQRVARLISLRSLSEAAVGSMLAALGHRDPPSRLLRKFIEETGGNPFFIEELFRYLNEERRLFDSQGNWRRDLEVEEIDVPAGVRMVINRRLQRLSTKTRSVLTAAAVIGRHFDLDLLEAVADVDSDTLTAALEQAEGAHLVKGPSGRQERRWRFAHQLICQTLTTALPQARRQRLHLLVAAAMARLDPGSQTYAADIAHHLYNAGPLADAAGAARALVTAGNAAHAVYATDEAVQHYRRAVEILKEPGGDQRDRLNAQERLADVLALIGDRMGAMEHYQELAGVTEKSRSRVDEARIVRKVGTLHWQGGDRAQATACYGRALTTLDGETAHIEHAHLYQELGLAAFRSGDNERAIQWAERALASAEAALVATSVITTDLKLMANAAIAHATNTIGVALARSGQLDAARERIEQSLTTAREHGLLDVACRGYANLGVLYSTVEPKRAVEVSLTGLELATKIGASSLQSHLYANLAAAYCALTDRCETEGLTAARAAASLDRELGQLDHLAVPLIVMAQIHQCQGELQQAQEAYLEALALAEKAGEPQLLVPCYDGLATIYLDRGDTKLAEQYLEKARELCERAGIDPDTLLVLPFLC